MNAGSAARPGDTVLVTGSSTGLGLETALFLAERGYRVYATVRNMASQSAVLEEAERRRVTLEIVELDVTDRGSIDAAISTITGATGSIFGLVNNAGIGLRGCLEDLTDDEIREVYEVNVFGTMAVTQRMLPAMRAAGRGRIVTISSVGGRIGTFGLSAYCSTKFALEGFAESLALELAPFGLGSILIEPGIINTTRWTVNRGLARGAGNAHSPYYEMFNRHETIAGRIAQRSRTQPVDVAKAVHHALSARRPRMRYVVGRPAAVVVALRRYMPAALFERLYFGTLLRRIAHGAPAS
jgi:NAD(P)-dependent dehydrogenase (short-subunit alcohol dehydrogenase family)